MAKLNFKNSDLLSLIAHSDQATQYRVSLEEAIKSYEKATGSKFDINTGIPDEFYLTKTPTLFLVKDRGIYLMTSAVFADNGYPKDGSHVAYATGYNPKAGDVYEKCRQAVGGDDLCECFELTNEIKEAVLKGGTLMINITEDRFNVNLCK